MCVDIANRVLRHEGMMEVVEAIDGASALSGVGPIAFLHLDSSDNPEDTFAQYVAAELLPGAVVVVDDAQASHGNAFGKATRLVTHLSDMGARFRIEASEPGYAALTLSVPRGKVSGVP